MGSMRLRHVLEAFVWHWKGMGIVQALSTVREELYDSGRPKKYYEYAPLTSVSASVSRFPSDTMIVKKRCSKWRI